MKNQLLHYLAIPFIILIFSSCSHVPIGASEKEQQAQTSTTGGGSGGNALESAALKSDPAAGPSEDSRADLRTTAGNEPAEDALAVSECPSDDADCDTIDEESSSDNGSFAALEEAIVFCDVSQTLWQKGEFENALESLDKAYSLIFDVDARHDAKLMQQKEELRFLISKRILEIYASRNIVATGEYAEIPMELNRHIEAELKLFTVGREKDFFRRSYQRSGRYRPYIIEALKEAGLPEELSWLPLIESGFMVRALSSARALGLWQFIPTTGYKFGLKRNSYVDERMDFTKSTHAAIAYLKELHNIFGDWSTVLAAYNCGEGRVLRTIRTQNVNYLDDFWDLYQRLPRETARYVPRFIATLHIVKNPQLYGLDDVEFDPVLDWDEVEINRQAHLKDIAGLLNVDLSSMELFNPELRYQIVPPEPYRLRLPKGNADILLAKLEQIPTAALPERARITHITHTVRSGETLGAIAHRYRSSVSNIMRANNLKNATIRIGSKLKIPVSSSVAAAPSGPRTTTGTAIHTVAQGDTLYSIASRYQTTIAQIRTLNNLSSTQLHVGQKLRIPGLNAVASERIGTYSVKKGDTPAAIARRHNMPLDRFLSINKLTPDSRIFPGQKLLVEESDA